ncbi:uncharacterized protein LOC132738893 [Ruditapes philippinarum]|uniref:uncharacterized protein LOC132738893 n=1 Tax=Ruditapes philippinarum TaxID=129788 RepID=UPI00295AFF16|nr:uncharacterized protein LOC132738893 [Ruditapes philippinarum]
MKTTVTPAKQQSSTMKTTVTPAKQQSSTMKTPVTPAKQQSSTMKTSAALKYRHSKVKLASRFPCRTRTGMSCLCLGIQTCLHFIGIGHEVNIDVEKLPDPIPHGNSQPVKLLSGQPTTISLDLETTDLIRGGIMPHITQIAAVNIQSGQKFNSYVIPRLPIKAENIAGSELRLCHLTSIYKRAGEDVLRDTFTAKNSEGQPRVTGVKSLFDALLPKLTGFLSKL